MAITKTKIDRGVQLADLEETYRARGVEISAELASIEPNLGRLEVDAALAGETSPHAELVERVRRLRAERDVADQAVAALAERRLEHQRTVWQAEATKRRRQAADLRREADAWEVRTHDLLAQLLEHEGVTYVPERPPHPGAAKIDGRWVVGAAPQFTVMRVPTSRSQQMRIEADQLEAQAAELEQRDVPTAGYVDGYDVAELVANVTRAGAMLAPSAGEIVEWAGRAGGPHVEHIARAAFGTDVSRARVLYHLEWRDGRISTSSYARVETLDEIVAKHYRTTAGERDERRRHLFQATKAQLLADGIGDRFGEGIVEQRAWELVNESDRAEHEAFLATLTPIAASIGE